MSRPPAHRDVHRSKEAAARMASTADKGVKPGSSGLRSEADRLKEAGWLSRLVHRPEIGSFSGMCVLLGFLAIAAGDVVYNPLGIKNNLAIVAQLGIIATGACMLMIAGEFDPVHRLDDRLRRHVDGHHAQVGTPVRSRPGVAPRGVPDHLVPHPHHRLADRHDRGPHHALLLHRLAVLPLHTARRHGGELPYLQPGVHAGLRTARLQGNRLLRRPVRGGDLPVVLRHPFLARAELQPGRRTVGHRFRREGLPGGS